VVTVAAGDGNGWVECRCGARHWGRHGAAGLLLLRPVPGTDLKPGQDAEVLLQLRAAWTHQGGSWGLVGGARDSHEDVVAAALREAAEEAGLHPDVLRVVGHQVGVDHGDWRYTYVVALAVAHTGERVMTGETDELSWVRLSAVPDLPLHSALEQAWLGLRPAIDRALGVVPG
jgi:8-oxo-dGTP diphosphatase